MWHGAALIISLSRSPETALTWYSVMSGIVLGQFVVYYAFVRQLLQIKSQTGLIAIGAVLWVASSIVIATNQRSIITDVAWNERAGYYLPSFGPLATVVGAPNYLFLLVTVITMVVGYRGVKSATERTRLQYVFLGLVVVVLGSLANFVPPLSGYPIDLIANVINATLIGYAIFRFHLLDITVVARGGLLYSISTVIISAGYFLIISLATTVFHELAGSQIFLLSLAVALVVAIVAQPMFSRIQSWIDRLFFREKYDSNQMLQRLSRTAAAVLDLHSLTGMILDEVTSTVHIERAAFLLKEEKSGEYVLTTHLGLGDEVELVLAKDHPIVEWLSGNPSFLTRHVVETAPQFRGLWGQEKADLETLGAELYFPVRAKGALVGIFVVGQKRAEHTLSLIHI